MIALLIVGAAAFKPIKDWLRRRSSTASRLAAIGAPASVCGTVTTKKATGNQQHVPDGHAGRPTTTPRRPSARTTSTPDADGAQVLHRRGPARSSARSCTTWSTATRSSGTTTPSPTTTTQMNQLRAIADKFAGTTNLRDKFKAAPVDLVDDGDAVPRRPAHRVHPLVGRRRRRGPDPAKQVGVWQYCSSVSRRGPRPVHDRVPLQRLPRAQRDVSRRQARSVAARRSCSAATTCLTVLRAGPRGHQQRVRGVDDHDVVDADHRHDPARAAAPPAPGVDGPHQRRVAEDRRARRRRAQQRGQRVEVADVVPPERPGTTATRPAAAAGSATAWSRRSAAGRARARRGGAGSAAIARSGAAKSGCHGAEQVEQHRSAGPRTCRRSSGRRRRPGSPRPRRATASRRTPRTARDPGLAGQLVAERGCSRTPTTGRWARCRGSPASRRGRPRPRRRTGPRKASGSAITWSAANEPITAPGSLALEQRRRQSDRRHRVARRRLGQHRVRPQLPAAASTTASRWAAPGHHHEPVVDQRREPLARCPGAATGRCR